MFPVVSLDTVIYILNVKPILRIWCSYFVLSSSRAYLVREKWFHLQCRWHEIYLFLLWDVLFVHYAAERSFSVYRCIYWEGIYIYIYYIAYMYIYYIMCICVYIPIYALRFVFFFHTNVEFCVCQNSFSISVHANTLQHFILCWAIHGSQWISIKTRKYLQGKETTYWLILLLLYTCFAGQTSKNISSSPSIESLPGGREFTGSPPLSASKKDSFFSTISRSRSQSKTMSRKESVSSLTF